MDLEQFEKLDAQVIGISTDSIATHEKFSKEYEITFPLVSDDDGSVKLLYGRGRVTYLIDKKGIIRFIQEGVPNNRTLLKKLRELQDGKQ